jgi:hypothetical protein
MENNKSKRYSFTEEFDICIKDKPQLQEIVESMSDGKPLKTTIEIIHEGMSRNHRAYTKESFTDIVKDEAGNPSGIKSLTNPIKVPILLNHDPNSECLGRIESAKWTPSSINKFKNGITADAYIVSEEAKKKIIDGRYFTVSIGGSTDKAECSICGKNLMEGYDPHMMGSYYDGKTGEKVEKGAKGAKYAHEVMGHVWIHEVSFVNIPGFGSAQIVSVNPEDEPGEQGNMAADGESLNKEKTVNEEVTTKTLEDKKVNETTEQIDKTSGENDTDTNNTELTEDEKFAQLEEYVNTINEYNNRLIIDCDAHLSDDEEVEV